jgi:hypothetical protein
MKKSFLYRFFVLLLAYLLCWAFILGFLSSVKDVPSVILWSVFGAGIGLFILILVINEIIIHKKRKK